MIPYFYMLFLTTGVAAVLENARMSRGVRVAGWVLIAAALTLFAGLRGDYVGADTIAYLNRFAYLSSQGLLWDSYGSAEIGIKLIYATALLVSDEPSSVLILASLVAVVAYIAGIFRNSDDTALSLFVFIAFGFFVFHLNGLRQGLALGFYLLAMSHIIGGSFWRYAAWVGVASLFHSSAIFTLPLYFVFRVGFSRWNLVLVVLLSVGFVLFLDQILSFVGVVNERYTAYGRRVETGGLLLTLFYVLLSSIFVLARVLVPVEARVRYDKYLMMVVFGAAIFVVVTATGSYVEMTRMALYFTVAMVFMWPILIGSIRDVQMRFLVLAGLVVSGSIFFAIYLGQIGGYIPYVLG
jgi:transmembrane protein EpsG